MNDTVLIRAEHIAYRYPGEPPLLENINLQIAPGERLGLLGAIGSGKSTLLHLLVGLLRPDGGTLEVFGKARRNEKDFVEVRRQAGLLFQEAEDQLFCPTVEEDVAFGPLNLGCSPAEARERVRESLGAVGLEGYEHRITHHLSGGEAKLVALASVLAMRPRVLLLDEPVSSLDPEATRRITALLATLPQAMVIVSHDEAFLEAVATRRVQLREGTLHANRQAQKR